MYLWIHIAFAVFVFILVIYRIINYKFNKYNKENIGLLALSVILNFGDSGIEYVICTICILLILPLLYFLIKHKRKV